MRKWSVIYPQIGVQLRSRNTVRFHRLRLQIGPRQKMFRESASNLTDSEWGQDETLQCCRCTPRASRTPQTPGGPTDPGNRTPCSFQTTARRFPIGGHKTHGCWPTGYRRLLYCIGFSGGTAGGTAGDKYTRGLFYP